MKLDTNMSFRATALKQLHTALFWMGLASVPAMAQVANSPIVFADRDAVTATWVQATSVVNGGATSRTDTRWLKVELHYSVNPPNGMSFQDEAEFKVWIEGRDLFDPAGKPGEGIAVGLTGSIKYVNLPAGKDVYAVFYVPPATIARFSAGGGTSDFDRKFNIHAEADVAGKPVDAIDKNKEQDLTWYTKLKQVAGMVYLQNSSPFLLADPDKYPPVKQTSSGQQ